MISIAAFHVDETLDLSAVDIYHNISPKSKDNNKGRHGGGRNSDIGLHSHSSL